MHLLEMHAYGNSCSIRRKLSKEGKVRAIWPKSLITPKDSA